MSESNAPRKWLPARPSVEHLKKQAKRCAKAEGLPLAKSQHRLAGEYGYRDWAELMRVVETMNRGSDPTDAIGRSCAAGELAPLESLVRRQSLYAACERGDAATIARILDENASLIDTPDDRGNTPLWIACQSAAQAADRLAVVELLIGRGAHVNRQCEGGASPLHVAALNGPIELVELLLRHGAREWLGDEEGELPRDYAARGTAADKGAIGELLTRPVIRDPNFRAAVSAIHQGDLTTLKRLLVEHPNLARDAAVEPACYLPSYFSNPKLLWFVANNPSLVVTMPANMVDVAAAILGAGATAADATYTLELVMTSSPARVQGLQAPLMRRLLAGGAIVSPQAVLMTLGHGERDAIETLLAAGQPMTAPIAAGLGHAETLRPLLGGIDPERLHDAFSMAVINGHIETTRQCLAAGAEVNRPLRVHTHSTALHHAAGSGTLDLIRLLLASGGNPTLRDTLWRSTPQGWAEHGGRADAAALLRSVE